MNSFYLNSINDYFSDYLLCFYVNITGQLQIIKITNIPNYYYERAIFPGERLIFESTTSALLEIYTSNGKAIPTNVIPCQHLRVIDEAVFAKPSL